MPTLQLSLQFARDPLVKEHRSALPRAGVLRWLRVALAMPKASAVAPAVQFNIRIVAEAEGRELNLSYRGKDYATNVLTFEYGAPPQGEPLEADIVLCAPVVAQEAAQQGKTLQAHYAHLLVHGALHALGFDHERAKDAKVMEALEIQALAKLGFANPYT